MKHHRSGIADLLLSNTVHTYHDERGSFRFARGAAIANTRQDMRGHDVPQDRLATLRYLNALLGKVDGGMMRGILAGSVGCEERFV